MLRKSIETKEKIKQLVARGASSLLEKVEDVLNNIIKKQQQKQEQARKAAQEAQDRMFSSKTYIDKYNKLINSKKSFWKKLKYANGIRKSNIMFNSLSDIVNSIGLESRMINGKFYERFTENSAIVPSDQYNLLYNIRVALLACRKLYGLSKEQSVFIIKLFDDCALDILANSTTYRQVSSKLEWFVFGADMYLDESESR